MLTKVERAWIMRCVIMMRYGHGWLRIVDHAMCNDDALRERMAANRGSFDVQNMMRYGNGWLRMFALKKSEIIMG